ncbi:MAG: NAD-dependent epimerase/dehydratase family protein [Planctomycetota bacterium]|nr:NAD-dependent epimerase/dehydratase family protein [Planctomycetota bacterium]MDP6988219.1 NAD-dependent epimerase/dehydratase family protein [Planctomycetota bacterium]
MALVGAGFIADDHREILAGLEEARLVAVCDPDLGRARRLAESAGGCAAVADVAELADIGVDVAHVLVPPDLHVPVARRLLEAGIGVFLEKPAAPQAASVRELGELAAARDLPLGVNHNHAFHPAFARLAARLRSGEIGRVEHVRVTWSVPLMQLDAEQYAHWMFRAPRNILFEQAVHPLSQVHALLGRVEHCQATVLGRRELLPGEVFCDRWLVAARAERGTAEVHLAFGQGFTRSSLEVIGTDGCLEADFTHDAVVGERATPWLDFYDAYVASGGRGRELRRDARRGLVGYLAATLGLRPRADAFFVGMRDSITAFHRALQAGEPAPVDAASAAEVLDWCEAVAAGAPTPPNPEAAPLASTPPRPGEVVVLGGTGFIGKRVVARLLDAGRPVTCLVRRTHSLPETIAEAARDGRLRLVRGSLEDSEGLADELTGAAAVVHLATGGGETWEEVSRSMVEGTRRVGEACAAAGVGRLLYVSSIASLYTGLDLTGELDDSTATDPRPDGRSLYSRGKIAAEEAVLDLSREHDLSVCILRPGVVVGAGTPLQHSGLGLWVRDSHCIGWGRGDHPLPLVWVEDTAEAITRAALHEGTELDGRALNLCAKVPLTAAEVVEELARSSGRALVFHPRSLALSQVMEVGKWLVKIAGGRRGIPFPSWRDLSSRSLRPEFSCTTARRVLGWEPVEEREAFLDAAVRIHGRGGDA